MDGLFHGKPENKMDDLGGFPIIFGNTHVLNIRYVKTCLYIKDM